MGVYKSRYPSGIITRVLNGGYNILLQLVKTKDSNYIPDNQNSANKIALEHLDGSKTAYNVRAVSGLYLHKFVTQAFEYRVLTHYPTKYATPFDAMFDYNDQIDTRFRGYKIWGIESHVNGIRYWWINSVGEYKEDVILPTMQFLSYTIEQVGV